MPHYRHTEGICLRRLNFSNTSQIAGFLTRDAGRLSFMAKGVTRAPKRGIRTAFDLLGRYDLVYTTRRLGSLQNLTERWLVESFRGLRTSLERTVCGYYAAELVTAFTIEGDPCPGLYDLVLHSLRNFETGKALGAGVVRLELGVLQEHGSCPSFEICAACGRPLPHKGAIPFSAASGGPICEECEPEERQLHAGRITAFPAAVIEALGRAVAHPGAEVVEPPDRIVAMSKVLRFHIRDMLGKELRMWRYLQGRHLSRSIALARRAAGVATDA